MRDRKKLKKALLVYCYVLYNGRTFNNLLNSQETYYLRVFKVAEYKSEVDLQKINNTFVFRNLENARVISFKII